MKLTPSDQILRLATKALEEDIKPNLESDHAKSTVDLIRACLDELLRREQTTSAIVADALTEGQVLVRDMRTALQRAGVPSGPPAKPKAANGAGAGAYSLGKICADYDSVLAELVDLGEMLHALPVQRRNGIPVDSLLRRAAEWEYRIHCDTGRNHPELTSIEKINFEPMTRDIIESFVRSVHDDGTAVVVSNLRRLHGGFAKQTYMFDLTDASGTTKELILRKMDPIPIFSLKTFIIEREFHLLKVLHQLGVNVAKPLWLALRHPGTDANFIITQRLPGQPPGTFFGASAKLPESMVLQIAENLAKLHSIDIAEFGAYINVNDDPSLLQENVTQCYVRTIRQWRDYYLKEDHLRSPAITYLFDWALANVPKDDRKPVLIHGDFNVHNMLADHGAITGIIDWEAAMFGAPEQDFAWAYRGISQHIEWDRFVSHYVAAGARQPNMATMEFFMVFAALFSLVGGARAVRNMQSGKVPDIRLIRCELDFVPELMRIGLASSTIYNDSQKSH
jgi:aminoglycoside phosphotransferase (APT) family kinase protein